MRFVLVHGGWQGGWAWDGVVSRLSARGHTVFAPTLLGSGDGDVDRSGVTFSAVGEDLIHQIEDLDLDDFVMVGHSGGGPVAQYVADRIPERLTRMVFIDAWVLRNGERMTDVISPGAVEAYRLVAKQRPDRSVPMDPDLWFRLFMQDATPEQLAATLPRLVPCPIRLLDDPVDLPRFFSLDLPTSFIYLRHDQAVSRERYQLLAARLGTVREVECDGSHEAMITRPQAVAEALLTAVEE